jgi:signal transduction histidine kinase
VAAEQAFEAAAAAPQAWSSDLGGQLFARIDPAGFEQLISHVLDSAIKHGGPEATVSVTTSLAADQALTIVIADTGPGLPADLTLFEPFARSSSANRSDSVGIGLHIV